MKCPGGYREYVPGGGHLNARPRGLEGMIEACPCSRGWDKIEACPGGIYILSKGVTFAIIVICKGARLYNGIAHSIAMRLLGCSIDY